MQTPPPYQQPPYAQPNQPPKNNSNKTVIIVIACVAGFFCFMVPIMAAILFPVFAQAKLSAKRTTCMSNVKKLTLATMVYAADNDDTLPFAANWNDAIRSNAGEAAVFHCPALTYQSFGYAFSATVGGRKTASIAMPQTEVLIFDSTLSMPNASSDLSTLPQKPRHLTNTIGFVDGHVEKQRPEGRL